MKISEENFSKIGAKRFIDRVMIRRNTIFSILGVIILLAGEVIYFQDIIFGGKTLGLGSDGLLINLMLEHWHDVFQGEVPFGTLRMFYPQIETLGYSDILMGPGVIFSLVRLCGVDFFSSLNISLILLHGIGVFFLFLVFRKLGYSRKVGILGIMLSFWSCSFSQLTWHLQFFSISYISIVLYGVVLYKKSSNKRITQRLLYLVIISVGLGGAFLSSFYTAYMTCLLVIFTFLLLGIHEVIRKKTGIFVFWKKIYENRMDCIVGAILQIPWLFIMLRAYWPAYRQLGTYDPEMTLAMAPLPMDLFRTMSYAPIESWIRSALPFQIDNKYQMYAENMWFERSCGWPLVTVVLLLGFLLYIMKSKEGREKGYLILLRYIAVSMLIIFFLSARYGTFCPWAHVLSHIIPGAAAIRVPGRCLGIFVIPLAWCICGWISELESSFLWKTGIRVFEILLFFLLGFTAVSKRYMRSDSEYFSQIINSCETPPERCEVMMIYSLSPEAIYDPKIQLVAWMLADRFDIYTINGYTGNYPKDWRLAYTDQNEYLEAVDYWLDQKEVVDRTGIYAYIPEANIWISYPDLYEFAIMNQISE